MVAITREPLVKIGRYKLPLQLDLGKLIKIKAENARHADNMGRANAKPAFIFLSNADINYSELELIGHDLLRGSLIYLAMNTF